MFVFGLVFVFVFFFVFGFEKRIADAEAEAIRLAADLDHRKAEEAREILQIEVSTPPLTPQPS